MKIKRGLLFLVFVVVFLCQTERIMACTIFTVTLDDGTILACNNEDWMYSIENTVQISAPDSGNYGRVCFYNSSYVQGGMNEYGLFYDGASCPATEVPYDNEKNDLGYDLGETALAKCQTVKEAEEFFSNYNIPGGFYDHLLFADALGNVAVFEWVENEFQVIWKEPEKKHQIITNFWLSDPTLGGYPCSRYDEAEETLSTKDLTFELSKNLLSKTRQDWGNGGTLYSNICNLNEQEVYLFYRGDAKQTYHFNLADELESMEPGTYEIMRLDEICCEEEMEEKVQEELQEEVQVEELEVEMEEEEEAIYTELEPKDNKNTAYELIPIAVVILIVVALIIKKHMRK